MLRRWPYDAAVDQQVARVFALDHADFSVRALLDSDQLPSGGPVAATAERQCGDRSSGEEENDKTALPLRYRPCRRSLSPRGEVPCRALCVSLRRCGMRKNPTTSAAATLATVDTA